MTVGMLMYYGGIIGIIIGVIMLLILSKVFASQRNKLKNILNLKETK